MIFVCINCVAFMILKWYMRNINKMLHVSTNILDWENNLFWYWQSLLPSLFCLWLLGWCTDVIDWAVVWCDAVVNNNMSSSCLNYFNNNNDAMTDLIYLYLSVILHFADNSSPPMQSSRAPSVEDDEEGHLIYRNGDLLQDRCSCNIKKLLT